MFWHNNCNFLRRLPGSRRCTVAARRAPRRRSSCGARRLPTLCVRQFDENLASIRLWARRSAARLLDGVVDTKLDALASPGFPPAETVKCAHPEFVEGRGGGTGLESKLLFCKRTNKIGYRRKQHCDVSRDSIDLLAWIFRLTNTVKKSKNCVVVCKRNVLCLIEMCRNEFLRILTSKNGKIREFLKRILER